MSHFTTIQVQYRSKASIVKVLQAMGFPVQTPEVAQHLKGYRGDVRPQTADIIVLRQHIDAYSNDLGFQWNPESQSYHMIISEYDQNWGNAAPGRGLGSQFVQAFTRHYAIAEVEAKGDFVIVGQERLEDGSDRLILQKKQQITIGVGSSSTATESNSFSDWVV